MMDNQRQNGRSREEILMPIKVFYSDNKTLLNDYITPGRTFGLVPLVMHVEECPNISPLSIIMDNMRRYLVMEQKCGSNASECYDDYIENNSTMAVQSSKDSNWKMNNCFIC
jgi:hypothetical protein